MTDRAPATLNRLFSFWAPLASTWLMMSVEGPFLAATIARLDDPKVHLAAYGVAFAIALIVESPVVMLLTAATALVEDHRSYARLRNFSFVLSAAVTVAMVLMITPAVFDLWARQLMGLRPDVARATWGAVAILLPWPGAIGYRRFYQGVMIRSGRPGSVAYGTVARLLTMAATAVVGYKLQAPGAWLGASALTAGVSVEAILSRWMARSSAAEIRSRPLSSTTPSYRTIVRFYIPLALTSFIGFSTQPLTTFFMGLARFPLESLAVLPVITVLTFVFRSFGLAYQEVAITFLARNPGNLGVVTRFAALLGGAASLGMALIAFTPLARFWFETVSGLSSELADFAILPTQILVLIPALSVLLSLQRAVLVNDRQTRTISLATAIELSVIASALMAMIRGFDMVGATAAALALALGRVASNGFLARPAWKTARARSSSPLGPRPPAEEERPTRPARHR